MEDIMNAIVENTNEIIDITDPETWPIWLDLHELAAVLRLSESTCRGLHASGKCKARKFGRRLRWHKDSVLALAR